MEQKTENEQEEREAPKSVRQHFVLSTRDPFLLRRPLPFIARKEAVCIQFFTHRIQPLDPRMYLLRPYMLLGARVVVKKTGHEGN